MPYPREERVCESCIYFNSQDNDETGYCQLHPPTVFMDHNQMTFSALPVVECDSFCGDGLWEKKTEDVLSNEIYSWDYDSPELCYEETRDPNRCCCSDPDLDRL